MQPIVHLLLSIVAGLGVGLHLENKKRKYLLISLLALAATGIDLDHFLPIYQQNEIAIFHNVFVFLLLPAALFWIFFVYERRIQKSIGQRACLLLCVMFLGHMFLDCIYGGTMRFLYPFKYEMFTIATVGISLDPVYFSLTADQVILIVWGGIVVCANIVETLIFKDVEEKERFELDSMKNIRNENGAKSNLPVIISGSLLALKLHFVKRK